MGSSRGWEPHAAQTAAACGNHNQCPATAREERGRQSYNHRAFDCCNLNGMSLEAGSPPEPRDKSPVKLVCGSWTLWQENPTEAAQASDPQNYDLTNRCQVTQSVVICYVTTEANRSPAWPPAIMHIK